MNENDISRIVVDSAIEVHRILGGPGLLESIYEEALIFELQQKGVEAQRQLPVPVVYKGYTISAPLRLDLLVGNKVIIECKSLAVYNSIYEAQLLTYLRLMDLKLGLVINFGTRLVKDGIHRVVNGLYI